MEVELISEVVATFNIYNINRRLPDLLQWLSETKSDIVCSARVRAMKAENVNRERAPQEAW